MSGLRVWVWAGTLAGVLSASHVVAAESEVLGAHEGWLDRMGAGVRELGRGNTGTALEDATPASYWNPALLPFFRSTQASVGADVRSLDRNGGFVSLQGPVASNLGLGLSVINRGDYNVQAYDANENDIGVARPQAFAAYLGMGLRTSRRNAFGVTLQWYSSTLDLGENVGDVAYVGGVNLGWYRRVTDSLSVAVVIRNLGLNDRLSAEFSQTVLGQPTGAGAGYAATASDFFPKTLVLAADWRKTLWHRSWSFAGELMDYQLKSSLFTPNPAFHAQRIRLGAECEVAERTQLRAGLDRANPTFGLGYAYRWNRRRLIQFDYALTLERGFMTFNPYAAGIKTNF